MIPIIAARPLLSSTWYHSLGVAKTILLTVSEFTTHTQRIKSVDRIS